MLPCQRNNVEDLTARFSPRREFPYGSAAGALRQPRVHLLMAGFRKVHSFSGAARADPVAVRCTSSIPGGPMPAKTLCWPPAPPKQPLTIFNRSCTCLPKGGAGSALKVLKLV